MIYGVICETNQVTLLGDHPTRDHNKTNIISITKQFLSPEKSFNFIKFIEDMQAKTTKAEAT